MNLQNAAVVITGASRGLGKELARAFLAVGARVIISGLPGPELQATAAELACPAVPADVTDQTQVEGLAQAAAQQLGRLDVWVNNAGLWAPHAPIEQQDVALVRKMVDVNFFGAFFGCRAAAAVMRLQGSGAIVNIVSAAALEGKPDETGYSSSKFAVRGLTESLDLELSPHGLAVVGVYTDRMKTDLFGSERPADYDSYLEPADVAARVVQNLQHPQPERNFIIRVGSHAA
jgi:NAD(P)-dependent dehydrogenase (short-subunit alcohol dehydrogenase family)